VGAKYLQFLLSRYRNENSAVRFFKKIFGKPHVISPRVINVDKSPTTHVVYVS
jgi:transposase-like protein